MVVQARAIATYLASAHHEYDVPDAVAVASPAQVAEPVAAVVGP